jgi:hypothetical protein
MTEAESMTLFSATGDEGKPQIYIWMDPDELN